MSTLDSLRLAPFNLDDAAVAWVSQTLDGLSPDARLRQLFNVMLLGNDADKASRLARMQPGGITRFVGPDVASATATLQAFAAHCTIPPLVSGDLEGGAIGLACGTPLPNQLGLAATGDAAQTGEAVAVLAAEGRALGYNWSFTPVVDINVAFRSTIVGTRSYGSAIESIIDHARSNVTTFQRHGIAACAKHWPGEGYDDRDQHLVTTINPLSVEDWHARYGRIYREMIASGVMTIMSAHIALPAYARAHGADEREACRPACVSRLLNEQLLREELGFNGLIVSDATGMAGFGAWDKRERMVPELIASGCDMLLFPNDMEEDLRFLQAALADGRLSEARVTEAATRVLGLKAALGLHRQEASQRSPGAAHAQSILRQPSHLEVSDKLAGASITLVKDVQQILPLSPTRTKRIVVVTDPKRLGFVGAPPVPLSLPDRLRARGFEVRDYDASQPPSADDTDLVLYLLAQESILCQHWVGIDWSALHSGFPFNMHRFWHELPCMLISLGHPYYLYQAPRMPCVINAYSAIEPVQEALVRKLLGEEAFTAISPVDAFCGLPDAQF